MIIAKAETVLAQGVDSFGRAQYLTHRPAGRYLAGAGTREEGESWCAVSDIDGTRHSIAKRSEAEAREIYAARVAA